MLSGDVGNKKARKIFLDIISIFLIITCVLTLLSFFGISIGFFFAPLLWLTFLINMFKFAKLTKKYSYIILFFLFVIGLVLGFIAFNISAKYLVESGEIANIIRGNPTNISLPTSYYIYAYSGAILTLISIISMLVFYFKYYRKYLAGEKSLKDLGIKEATNERKFIEQWKEKEKKQDKVGWIIIAILVLLFIALLIYMALQ
jgi:hypothetical protein